MSLLKDIAVVLRRLDYSETSQVLVVFTREHGQQRMIAKGIKRGTRTRVAVGVDLLELGQVVFSARPGKEDVLSTMTEWRQEDGFPHLRRDLAKLYAAQYAAEVTSQLTEPFDPHPALFDALVRLLRSFATAGAAPALVGYLRDLLREIGLQPELAACVSCGRPVAGDPVVFFSSRQGGAVCRDCEPAMVEKRSVAPEALRLLREGNQETSPASVAEVCGAFDVLDYHLRETMAKPARLSEPLRRAIGMK